MVYASVSRRLAAILAVDMVGYSRLMHADEAGTHATYKADLTEVFESAIPAHNGRIVKHTGDGLLAAFDSAVEAVACAVAIQQAITRHRADVPDDRRVLYRIGVNLGDILVEEHDIFGDGVNIAARLESIAPPGGICISGNVYDQVRNKLAVRFVNLGRQRVKNIAAPVHVYRVVAPDRGIDAGGGILASRLFWLIRVPSRRALFVVAALLLAVVGASVGWQSDWLVARMRVQLANFGLLSEPKPRAKPSIAILAFKNIGGDPDQEYFADGIAEDIITDLSQLSGLFVIARTSSFYYKDKSVPIKQIGRDLGIKYVLEGSVRKAGSKMRVSAQLIDVETLGHVWAARYDRDYRDTFAIQDEITRKIVDALLVELTVAEQKSRMVRGTVDIEAYDSFLKGLAHLRRTTPEDMAKSAEYFGQVLAVDAASTRAHAAMAAIYLMVRRYHWHRSIGLKSPYDAEALAFEHIRKSMRAPSSLAYRVRAEMYYLEGRYGEALTDLDRALALDSNDPESHALLGRVHTAMGEAASAIAPVQRAMRLDPNFRGKYLAVLGIAEFALGHFDKAAALLETTLELNPENHIQLVHLTAAYGHLGRNRDARETLRVMNALRAKAGIGPYKLFIAGKAHYDNECDVFRLVQGLKKAGVPQGPQSEPSIDGTRCGAPPR